MRDRQDEKSLWQRTYPDHPVFILIILFAFTLFLDEDENMMVQDGRR